MQGETRRLLTAFKLNGLEMTITQERSEVVIHVSLKTHNSGRNSNREGVIPRPLDRHAVPPPLPPPGDSLQMGKGGE